jgi:hypothetical protein
MKLSLPLCALLLAAAFHISGCGSEKKPQADSDSGQQVNIPFARQQPGEIAPVDVPEDKLPDLSGLSNIEAQIFKRSIALQIPYYDAQYKWAEHANSVTKGEDAAASMKAYLNIQNEFARAMQRLDLEFAGKIDPNYVGSKAFEKAIDEYMEDAELMRRIDFIVEAFQSLMVRFKKDPACQAVLAEIQRIAEQPQ